MKSRLDHPSISFEKLSVLRNYSSVYARLGDDYIVAEIDSRRTYTGLAQPTRVDGWMMILCTSGSMDLEIDLRRCRLDTNCVACVGLDNIVRDCGTGSTSGDFSAIMLVISPAFMRDLNIDLNVINISAMAKAKSQPPSTLKLTREDAEALRKLLELLCFHTSAQMPMHYKRSIVKGLSTTMLYQLMMFGDRLAEGDTFATPRTHRSAYVHKFMRLVQQHHTQERSVGFYAGKMYISPKYLSLIIKENTGRSASEWIDDMVILEAKNMLRFSGKNIQQVAYDLNFSNQSSFGKYFKHLTGMSPSEYQKSSSQM